MKGVLIALALLCLAACLVPLGLRCYLGRQYYWVFLAVFLLLSPLFVLWYAVTPPNLFLLPPGLLEPAPAVDAGLGFLLWVLLYHSYWDLAYGAALTGFSAGMLVLLRQSGKVGMSIDQLQKAYQTAPGVDLPLAWRLPKLVAEGFLTQHTGAYALTRRGRYTAHLGLWIKRIFNMGAGG